jgi:hypothetical protein
MTTPTQSQAFQFLDVGFVFQSDHREWLARFTRQYARFIIDCNVLADNALVLKFENGQFSFNDRVWPLKLDGEDGYIWLHLAVINAVMQRVRGFDLLHAGTLGWQGDGIMLSGLTQHGKTTLTLALVQAGLDFLSDEFAALSRSDGLLQPLPRQVSIRPKTIPLLKLDHITRVQPVPDGRRMVDIDLIRPNAVAPALPLRHLFLLNSPDSKPLATQYAIITNHTTDEWLAALGKLESLRVLRTLPEREPTVTLVNITNPGAAFPGIAMLCEAHDVLLIMMQPSHAQAPGFDQSPTIRALPRSEAAIKLLQHYQNGVDSIMFQEVHGGNPLQLFARLTELLADVACWELSIGRLDETVTLVRSQL